MDRLTIPNITPARCKETKYSLPEELAVVRQRLYELENRIDNKTLVEIPGILSIDLPVYKRGTQRLFQVLWYDEDGCIRSSIEPTLDQAQKVLEEIIMEDQYND